MAFSDRVVHVAACDLVVCRDAWGFAETHKDAIEAHWARRTADNPNFFNGTIFVLGAAHIAGDTFHGFFLKTDFRSFLYWREQAFPAAGARDAFGSAIIRAGDGSVLLGRQSAGNVNSGLAYPPGGFIDQRDVDGTGHIDLAASIARELSEETGLAVHTSDVTPGYIFTFDGSLVSMGIEYRFSADADALRATILAHTATEAKPELADIVIVRSAADIDGARVPPYTTRLLRHLFQTA